MNWNSVHFILLDMKYGIKEKDVFNISRIL